MVALALPPVYDRIVLTHRGGSEEEEAARARLAARGAEVLILRRDAARPEDAAATVAEAMARFGRVDALVHAAGPYLSGPAVADTSAEAWAAMIDGNLASFFHHLRAVLPIMRRQRFGRVVAFAHAEATELPPWPGRGAYAAAKAGVLSLVRTVAVEEAPYGITAHAVLPGNIREPHKLWTRAEALRHGRTDEVPVGRYGTGEDVARVVAFLLAEESDFLTGWAVPVDGAEVVIRRRRRDGHV
jgi:3-oxoacyl-[acyl-carrier protein] reductase